MTLRVANGAGFLGDQIDAPRRLVEQADVDYLTLEYLAELTLSILARLREKDPNAGYAQDLLDVLTSLEPALRLRPQMKIVTNGGGVNPRSCVAAAAALRVAAGCGDERIGLVEGDDLLNDISELQRQGCPFVNLDSGARLADLNRPVVSANAYLGAAPIVEALADGARLVITGRVADASLTLGPAMHAFGWAWDDWDRLAGATVAGHLIECGSQITGGYAVNWSDYRLHDVGYPIAELEASGDCVVTKPAGSGGAVTRRTVSEQLVYEIGDPRHYLTPDVDVDFTTVELDDLGGDRVAVGGARGVPAPDDYKVSLAYRDGFTSSGQLTVYGADCTGKARACADILFQRLDAAGVRLARTNVELLGAGDGVPGVGRGEAAAPSELVLRISVADPRREAVERFTREFAPLITSGPAGLAGYAVGRAATRSVVAYWPTLVPKKFVRPRVEVRAARDWLSRS